jgi:hypothetical protein
LVAVEAECVAVEAARASARAMRFLRLGRRVDDLCFAFMALGAPLLPHTAELSPFERVALAALDLALAHVALVALHPTGLGPFDWDPDARCVFAAIVGAAQRERAAEDEQRRAPSAPCKLCA